jgi:hypothetical protein
VWRVFIGHKPQGLAWIVLSGFLLFFPWGEEAPTNHLFGSAFPEHWLSLVLPFNWLSALLNLSFSLLLGFMFHALLIRQNVFERTTYLPVFFIVWITGSLSDGHFYWVQWFSSLFICLSCFGLLQSPGNDRSMGATFQGGLCLGIAQFGLLASLVFTPLFVLGLVWNGKTNSKTIASFLLGNFIPWLYLFTFWTFTWDKPQDISLELGTLWDYSPNFSIENFGYWALPLWWLCLSMVSFFDFTALQAGHRSIEWLFSRWFALFFVGGICSAYLHPSGIFHQLHWIALPLALFFTFYFLRIKKDRVGNLWLLVWLGLAFSVKLFG